MCIQPGSQSEEGGDEFLGAQQRRRLLQRGPAFPMSSRLWGRRSRRGNVLPGIRACNVALE
eukprot:9389450-Pyramimonas_sp.AAC.1